MRVCFEAPHAVANGIVALPDEQRIGFRVGSEQREIGRAIVQKLVIPPEQLVRKGEDVFKEKYAGKTLTDAQWIEAMVKHPILIERPIVVRGDKAIIGRPPENANQLL